MLDDIRETTRKEKDRAYQQGRADALNIDMDEPMHFTDEQKAWVKKYILINAERQRADALDELVNKCDEYCDNCYAECFDCQIGVVSKLAEQLKEGRE